VLSHTSYTQKKEFIDEFPILKYVSDTNLSITLFKSAKYSLKIPEKILGKKIIFAVCRLIETLYFW
jgi:hypothetical protein